MTSLALDISSGIFFWSDGGQIWSANLNGQNRQQYIEGSTAHTNIAAISLHSGQLYYANSTDSTVRRIAKDLTSEILHSSVRDVIKMLVAHSSLNPLPTALQLRIKECQRSSIQRGCLCIPTERLDTTCKCSDQEDIDTESGKCIPPKKFLLIASPDRFVRFKIQQYARTLKNIYTKVLFVGH